MKRTMVLVIPEPEAAARILPQNVCELTSACPFMISSAINYSFALTLVNRGNPTLRSQPPNLKPLPLRNFLISLASCMLGAV